MPDVMRVLAIGNAYPPHLLGGYEVIWRGVMRRLRREGHELRILTSTHRRGDVAVGEAENPDVHRQLAMYWRDHDWLELGLRASYRLERHNAALFDDHIREFRPDVLSWWPLGGLSLGLVERARLAGLPASVFVLDYWPEYGPVRDRWIEHWNRHQRLGALVARLTGLPTTLHLAQAGTWVFCSEVVRRGALDAGVDPIEWSIIRPGVSEDLLRTPPPADEPWDWRLLYIGRVIELKGVHTAISAMPLLPAQTTLRIVGDGDAPYRARLEALAAELGVEDRVALEPSVPHDRVAAVYRAADAVLFPVQWPEPWGLVPLEAMALRRPLIATGRGGSGDYLVDERNSLLVPADDPAALAAVVNRLADDPGLRQRLVQGGRETADANAEDQFNTRAAEAILTVRP